MTQTPLVGSTFFGMDLSVLADRFWMFRRRVSKRVLLLEFGSASLTVAQARYGLDEVEFTHVRRVELPPGATERGVPTEPAKMASLIQQICKEEKIYARRTAVVLPAKAAFNTIIQLPPGLTLEEARAYARNPSSGLQIPIPLQQTDFDLVPCSGQVNEATVEARQPYFLSSVPQKLVDQLLDTLQRADLEALSVDLAFCCQLRLMAADAAALGPGEFLLLLECVRECSHLVVVSNSGPVALFRLSAIREFPTPAFGALKTDVAVEEALSAEAITLADDGYMPLSDLDLRVLVPEIQQAQQQFSSQVSAPCWKGMAIIGVNTAHPVLAELLMNALRLEVHVLRPLEAKGVGAVSFSSLLVHQSLGRLFGLGLGLLSHDALVACSLVPPTDYQPFESLQDIPSLPALPLTHEATLTDAAVDLIVEPLDAQQDSSIPSVSVEGEEAVREPGDSAGSENEGEWPNLRLGVGEDETAEPVSEAPIAPFVAAMNVAAEADADGVEEVPEISSLGELRLSEEEEEWPSIPSVSVEGEEAVREPGDSAGSENEGEWPSLRLAGFSDGTHHNNTNPVSSSMDDPAALKAMNVKQLKQCCRDLNLSGYSALRKDELIKIIATHIRHS